MQWGLEAGIAAGIVLATLYFAWGYAQVRQMSRHCLAQDAALPGTRPRHVWCSRIQ